MIIEGNRKLYPPNPGAAGWVISCEDCWLPGVYENEAAAHEAFNKSDETLQALQDSVNPGGIITMDMLKSSPPTDHAKTDEGEAE